MRKIVYIETTIPSFYYEARPEPDRVARKQWTQDWWDNHSAAYDLVTSEATLDELCRGEYPQKDEAIVLIRSVPFLPAEEEVADIVAVYIAQRVMPADTAGDALHLAMASYWKCDFLLTWNCSHLANANKFEHIRHVNNTLGLYTPTIVTPLELTGKEAQDEG